MEFSRKLHEDFSYLELRQENEEKELDVQSYVQIIKDALHLNKSVCLARNFHQLHKDDIESNRRKVFIDIWPVSSIEDHLLKPKQNVCRFPTDQFYLSGNINTIRCNLSLHASISHHSLHGKAMEESSDITCISLY